MYCYILILTKWNAIKEDLEAMEIDYDTEKLRNHDQKLLEHAESDKSEGKLLCFKSYREILNGKSIQ